ncbi:MAG: hypothetical protein KAJ14_05990 [Candidatus Omnitrophica bacterium]|nr:hypothetical protein [Candidatus Omnitrophota bacterium]
MIEKELSEIRPTVIPNNDPFSIYSIKSNKKIYLRLPIFSKIYKNSIKHGYPGSKQNLTGYLIPKLRAISITKIQKNAIKYGISDELTKGYQFFDFFPEPTCLEREAIIISPLNLYPKRNIPYNLLVIYVGIIDFKHIYFLKKLEETTLKFNESCFDELPPLNLNDLIKLFSELNPSLSRNKEHLSHSVLSNYIGSDYIKNPQCIDGLNSSYGGDSNTKLELNKINNIFENKERFVPFSHCGIINILNENHNNIQRLRMNPTSLKLLKTVSYNLPYNKQEEI